MSNFKNIPKQRPPSLIDDWESVAKLYHLLQYPRKTGNMLGIWKKHFYNENSVLTNLKIFLNKLKNKKR